MRRSTCGKGYRWEGVQVERGIGGRGIGGN